MTHLQIDCSFFHACTVQANPTNNLWHMHLSGNKDPDADPSAGAKVVLARPDRGNGGVGGGGGQFVIAEMSKAEQMMSQALNIARQLRENRNLHIHE